MANNCLVTKLKGVVDNPNLPKLGEMTFKILKNKRRTFFVEVSEDITLTVTGGLFKDSYEAASGVTTVTAFANQGNYFNVVTNEGVDAIIKVSNKYVIKRLNFDFDSAQANAVELDADLLGYSPLAGAINLMMSKDISGNLSKILKSQVNVNSIDIFWSNISGTTEDIANALPAGQLLRLSAADSGLTGSINHLAKFPGLGEILGWGISGTIEEFGPLFLNACIEQGVASADVIIKQVGVTYQGNAIPNANNHLVVSNGSWSFTLGA